MTKQASAQPATDGQQATRKMLRKLKKARTAQQRAERKVGKLRVRLEQAEVKLTKRIQRLSTVQARLHPAAPDSGKPRKAKTRRSEHDRLVTIGLADPNGVSENGVPAPIAAHSLASADAQSASNEAGIVVPGADQQAEELRSQKPSRARAQRDQEETHGTDEASSSS